MTMRAVLERNTATARDPYGGPVAPTWAPLATVPCRVWHDARPVALVADGDKTARVQPLLCALPLGTDVRETDRVARIQDRLGRLLHDGPLRIVSALRRRTGYLEAQLERAS